MKTALFILALTITPAIAADKPSLRELLTVANLAGSCETMEKMVEVQNEIQLPDGVEFVTRFWQFRAADLGVSVGELTQKCKDINERYDQLQDELEAV